MRYTLNVQPVIPFSLSTVGGPETATRRVLATSTGMRNAMVALLVALTSSPDSDVDLAVLVFSALMVPPNLILTLRDEQGDPSALGVDGDPSA